MGYRNLPEANAVMCGPLNLNLRLRKKPKTYLPLIKTKQSNTTNGDEISTAAIFKDSTSQNDAVNFAMCKFGCFLEAQKCK
jgi:hypothetical protein